MKNGGKNKCCIYNFGQCISKFRPMLSMSNAETLIHAFMTSRLYYNALLQGSARKFGIGPKKKLPLDGGPEHRQRII